MIQPKELVFLKDQKKESLSHIFTPMVHDQRNNSLNDGLNGLSPKSTICLAIDILDNEKFITALQREADKGVRIYLLLGEESDNKNAISKLTGRCLIRCGVRQAGGFLLQDGNTSNAQGWLISGRTINQTLIVNGQHCDDLYRVFCHLFWQQAGSEYLEQNKPSTSVTNSPIGEILLNAQHNLPNKLKEMLIPELEGLQIGSAQNWSKQMLWQLVSFNQARGKLLLIIPENEKLDSLESLCDITDVRFGTQPMGNLLITSQGGWWLPDYPDPKKVNWVLRLDQDQRSRLNEYLQNNWQQANWKLQSQVKLGDLVGQVRFANQPGKTFEIEEQLSMTLEAVEAPDIDNFINPNIEQLCADQTHFGKDRLAHIIEYKVKLCPPRLPIEAKQDPIESQWGKQQELWLEKLNSLKNRINQLIRYEEKLSERVKNKLSGFLLGQHQKVSEIMGRLQKLCDIDVGRSSPALLEQWTQELYDLEIEIKKRESRCQQQEVHTRKEIEWEDECKKMDDAIKHLEEKVQKQESNLKNASEELERAKEILLHDKDSSQSKKTRKELDKYANNEKQARTSLENTTKQLSTLQSRRKKEMNFCSPEDIVIDDAETLGKVLGNKPADIKFKPDWPKEFLPPEGMHLYECNQQRWLIIQDLDQLEDARVHSSRLNAKIGIKQEI
ncbi:MAG: hypothetical protein SCH39_07495 [Methanosarcinales archaeon]|nr:hypothetical protein [Methanosarcinales archaeon]